VRAFGLWGIGLGDLDHAYREFRPFLDSCKFGDCSHTREPGCAVRAATDREVIPAVRYASYLKLREELEQDSSGELQRHRGLA
jgi:ribosome biogenesis GTPase